MSKESSKDFLDLSGYAAGSLQELIDSAAQMKRERYRGGELAGRALALVFEKPSLRTRTTLELAAFQLGAHAVYLDQHQIGLGEREPVADVAQNLSRWVDAIAARVHRHQTILELAQASSVPVINALSDYSHPLQALADLLTLKEEFGRLEGLQVAWVGDGNNVLASLIEAADLVGMAITVASPEGYQLPKEQRGQARFYATPQEAVAGAHAVYTDVWVSMGQEGEALKRKRDFAGFEVTPELLAQAGPEAIFMHCLPAHYGEETSPEVVHGLRSRAFDQAENRLHTAKALLLKLLGEK